MTADKLNKADPGIWIELGGEKRKIVFSMHSLKQTEKLLGKNLLNQEIDTGEIDELVALLWAALLTENPELDGTIDQEGKPDDKVQAGLEAVAKWFTMDKIADVADKIRQAFEQARPDKAEDKTPAREATPEATPEADSSKNE